MRSPGGDCSRTGERTLSPEELLHRQAKEAWNRGDVNQAVDSFLDSASHALASSHNYEAILLNCRAVLNAKERDPSTGKIGRAVAAWQMLGLSHAYLERYDDAAAAFAQVLRLSPNPRLRAQACYFAGLVRAKRQGDFQLGSRWFSTGLKELVGLLDVDARLERGWLLNGCAFVAWMRGDRATAHSLITQAVENIRPIANLQLQNLEVNLINNLSVLQESDGDVLRALTTWRQIRYVADLPGRAAAKAYHYREAWLLMQAGATDEAAAAYQLAYDAASEGRDLFHMNLVARAAGFMAYERNRLSEARRWFEKSQQALDDDGDGWHLVEALVSLAIVSIAADGGSLAIALLDRGVRLAARVGRSEMIPPLRRALSALRSESPVTLSPHGDYHGLRLEPPKAKLTSPFRVADLSSVNAFDESIHSTLPLGVL
jgi:tetratricopeptide (TPR) repeat protein